MSRCTLFEWMPPSGVPIICSREFERDVLAHLVTHVVGIENQVPSRVVLERLGYKQDDSTLRDVRKVTQRMRNVHGIFVVGDEAGIYVSNDPAKIRKWANTMQRRAELLLESAARARANAYAIGGA